MTERVLVLSAHSDDETIGCGGTIAKHAKAGDDVRVMTFTDGVASRGAGDTDARASALHNACRILGARVILPAAFPDNAMDSIPLLNVVKLIEFRMSVFKPTTVYTHYAHDLNVDHRVVCEAARVVCRPQPGSTVKRLLHFEVPCSTAWAGGFAPNYFIELDADLLALKLTAFAQYETEVREYPHPRSRTGLEDLAHWRGASIGVRAAEAFMLERWIA